MKKDWPKRGEQCGIYAIENTRDGKFYIGQAQDIYARWHHHVGRLRAGEHCNLHLQRAWNRDGEGSFRFVLLERAEVSQLDAQEQVWIDALNAVEEGYNMCPAAGAVRGKKHSDETREKMSKSAEISWEGPKAEKRRQKAAEAIPARAEKMREGRNKPEAEAKRVATYKETCATPEAKARKSAAALEVWGSMTPERRKKRSDALRETRSTPEAKARLEASKESRSEKSKQRARAKSKFNEDIVATIRSRYVPRCPINGAAAMGREFGVTGGAIQAIITGKNWK